MFGLNLICRNGQFKIEAVSKYGGEFPIHEQTWALLKYIAVASDAVLPVNVKSNCRTENADHYFLHIQPINQLTSVIFTKGSTGVLSYNKKH